MPDNTITVVMLGTSGSVPTKNRALPAVAMDRDGDIFLFDCGEGTQRQFLIYGININKLKCIFISHLHGDHVIGLAGIVRTLAINKRTSPLIIFVPKGAKNALSTLIEFDNAKIPYTITIEEIEKGEGLDGKDYSIKAFRLDHSINTLGYIFKINDRFHFDAKKAKLLGIKGEMFSKILKNKHLNVNNKSISLKSITTIEKGKIVVYAPDTRPSKRTVAAADGADLLIHESTYTKEFIEFAKNRKHSCAFEAAEIARSAKVKKLLLFHISSRYNENLLLLTEAKKIFKNSIISYDGMKIKV